MRAKNASTALTPATRSGRAALQASYDAMLREAMPDDSPPQPGAGSVAKLHVEDIPALWAGYRRCGVLIGDPRDAISVELPLPCRSAVGSQELRFRLRSAVPVDDVVLSVADRRSEYIQSCYGDRECQKFALHGPAPFPVPDEYCQREGE